MLHKLIYAFLFILNSTIAQTASANPATLSPLKICTSPDTCHSFRVEVANTEQSRHNGLMHRKTLPPNHGMLFTYPIPKTASMWMKDTLIPLDILFIDTNHQIIKIVENTKPLSLNTISSDQPITAILEINGGVTKKLGIDLNSTIVFPGQK